FARTSSLVASFSWCPGFRSAHHALGPPCQLCGDVEHRWGGQMFLRIAPRVSGVLQTRSGFSVSNYRVYWFQQESGSPPRYLLNYYTDSDKGHGSGVPARFSISKDTSMNAAYLTITGAQAEDEAAYHCAAAQGSGSTWQFAQ
uniref:Immunoglobulin V-set domain-containing protein n=1 Tax=Varanus komodoensis TaxID=61221 RepID=A0A8D2JEP5_VARKO